MLTHCTLLGAVMMPCGDRFYVSIGSDNGLFPELLPESVLTNHQWGLLTFSAGQFHSKYSRLFPSLIWIWKLINYDYMCVCVVGRPKQEVTCASRQWRVSCQKAPKRWWGNFICASKMASRFVPSDFSFGDVRHHSMSSCQVQIQIQIPLLPLVQIRNIEN